MRSGEGSGLLRRPGGCGSSAGSPSHANAGMRSRAPGVSIGVDERDEQDAEPPGLSPESAGVALECVGMVSEADSCAGGGVLAVPLSASASVACRSMGVGRKVISMMWGLGEWQGQKKRARCQPLTTGHRKPETRKLSCALACPTVKVGHNKD